MLSFSLFSEAWITKKPDVRSHEVSGTKTYDDPTEFRREAKKIGEVGGLHLYSSNNAGGGMTHYTYHPKDKNIHHVLTSVENTPTDSGGIRMKYLTAHARKDSPVRMHQVYSSLIKDHDRTLVGTSHSEGAAKMWHKMHQDPDIDVHGERSDGSRVELNKEQPMHASTETKDPTEKKIGQMALVAHRKSGE